MNTKEITLIAILSSVIFITGLIKIPSIVPGFEFQLSAPVAVAICAVFGFRKYITAGIIASIIALFIGAANINNIIVAMSFRIAVGAVISLIGINPMTIIISGPIGTAFARFILSIILGVSYIPLLGSAVIGMIFTAITSPIIYGVIIKVVERTSFRQYTRSRFTVIANKRE